MAWVRLSNLVYHVYHANSVYSHHQEILSNIKQSTLFQFKLKNEDIAQVLTEIPAELKKIEMLFDLAF